MINDKNVLITGASGFIGSHLTKTYLNIGFTVHIIIRPKSKIDHLNKIKSNLFIHTYDGTTENLFDILRKIKPILVIHLAASFSNSIHKFQNIDNLVKSNILFGTQLLEAMVMNDVKYFINTGTSWQHYESKNYSPICLYSATKQAFKDVLQYYVEATDLRVITLKLYHTYGPDDRRNKLFCLLRNAIKNKQVLKMTPGEQLIDIVFIDDVVDAYVKASYRLISEVGSKAEEFFVSSGNHITLKALVKKYYKIMNEKENIIWGGNNYRLREEMAPYNKGKILPGWSPRTNINQGIKIMEGLL